MEPNQAFVPSVIHSLGREHSQSPHPQPRPPPPTEPASHSHSGQHSNPIHQADQHQHQNQHQHEHQHQHQHQAYLEPQPSDTDSGPAGGAPKAYTAADYKARFLRSKAKYDRANAMKNEAKEGIKKAIAKQSQLQDEIDFLLDSIQEQERQKVELSS